ncbi:MAG: hypothetical protein WCS70_06790 [Verrucomicrobiota bacterium]
MCLGAGSPPAPTPPPEPLKDANVALKTAKDEQSRRAALMAGLAGTQKTGGLGVPGNANVAVKTLLGQ